MIPLPFTRVVFAYGDPIPVPRDLDDSGVEALRRRVEESLEGAVKRAQGALAEEALWRA
ncbi:MAG: hypothetical protein ACOYXN_04820 [Acidobacteriota bacterium]